jgi:hypothetical protein
MPQGVSPPDRVVVERLLSELARRADGAIDFWTTVCLAPDGVLPAPREFVAANGEILRSFAVSLRAVLAEAGLAEEEPVRGLLAATAAACRRIEEATLLLAQFRSARLTDVRAATESLAEGHAALLSAVRQVGEALGCSVAYWQQRTAERERHYQQILHGLFDLFRDAHSATAHPQAAGSGSDSGQ